MSHPSTRRTYVSLSDRLRAIFRYECSESGKELQQEFNIGRSTFYRMIKDKASWKEQAASGTKLTAKRKLYAKHPEIDSELLNFVRVARENRSPVTRQLMQERAKLTASSHGITRFKGSNGYITNFIRRNSLHSSVRLHGQRGSKPPANHLEHMENLQAIASIYHLR